MIPDTAYVEQTIMRELRRGPRTVEQLHQAVYGAPVDGGPSEVSLQKHISNMRRNRGVEIRRVSVYSL